MNIFKHLIFIDGKDKSDSIKSYHFNGSKCDIVYKNSSTVYSYNRCNVQVYILQEEIDLEKFIVYINGDVAVDICQLLDFEKYYKAIYSNSSCLYLKKEISLQQNCLLKKECSKRFKYFQNIASEISLIVEDEFNILEHQYNKIQRISNDTALASYLSEEAKVKHLTPPDLLIYPFGLNQSQKKAVENAFSSQISIIQGPPGTGKTQTILNIIANAIMNQKSVAVVSNNNSAIYNVLDKLQKKQLDFLTAFLGSQKNKKAFLEGQATSYPDMENWKIPSLELSNFKKQIKALSEELQQRFNDKNRIAEIEQELLSLEPESQYFEEYYQSSKGIKVPYNLSFSSTKFLMLLNEYEGFAEKGKKLGLFAKLKILFQYSKSTLKIFFEQPEVVIPYLQKQFYITKIMELYKEKKQLEKNLKEYSFDDKIRELTKHSMRLFLHEIRARYRKKKSRPCFDSKSFYQESSALNQEYPIIFSTTYSIKSCLDIDYIYDYLIVDESSQVNLVTGVLALSCARNVVIVGDLQQLPNVLTDIDIKKAKVFWDKSIGNHYDFTQHNLLSSALAIWKDAPEVLLKEHYRCHPKIIKFCNQKFYDGKLIVMTEDKNECDTLSLYRTSIGNHARGHMNQREVDVILNEVLPKLQKAGYQDIGVITPYRDQVKILQEQLPNDIEVDTVHKFQGREKDAIILTSVDNIITDFVDDYRMLNVAVSRAVKALVVVTSQNSQNENSNYGDLARYISYHNFEIINSKTYSVFDLLYQAYAKQRQAYLKKHKRISEYESENLMYALLSEILQEPEFHHMSCAVHVSLSTFIKDYSIFSLEEQKYARNPLTHTDFLLFNKMDKEPILAIEVDGTSFHRKNSIQEERDNKKNHIFEVCGIALLRIKTDGSGEKEKIKNMLRNVLIKS